MHKRLSLSIMALAAGLLLAAPGAPASTEAGWNCVGDDTEANWTLLASPSPGFSMSISPLVKESRGVLTNWTVRVGPGLGPLVQQFGVFHAVNDAGDYQKLAETTATVSEGTNEFPARLPVQAGDVLGIYGPIETLVCDEQPGAASALFEGSVAVGETKTFTTAGDVRPPVSAVIEPDADGDGYGDQSQDGCPESAAFQTECPIVAIDVGDATVKRRAILIEASVNTDAAVEAIGEVRWWGWPKSSTEARRSTVRRPVKIGLSTAAPQWVGAGTIAVLRVPLPKSVRRRLDRLKPSRGLRARIDVKATNLVPYVGTHELKMRLPGRKRSQSAR